MRCDPRKFTDGYGAQLDRTSVCYDPQASVVVTIVVRGGAGLAGAACDRPGWLTGGPWQWRGEVPAGPPTPGPTPPKLPPAARRHRAALRPSECLPASLALPPPRRTPAPAPTQATTTPTSGGAAVRRRLWHTRCPRALGRQPVPTPRRSPTLACPSPLHHPAGDIDHLDISVYAFEKLADLKWGVIAL